MFPVKKPGPNRNFNSMVSKQANQAADEQEAQHAALEKMANPTTSAITPSPALTKPSMPSPVPGVAPAAAAVPAAAPLSPTLPGAPAKGQFFPGLMAGLRKPKIPGAP